ncbi:hypothetical protein RP20_CCG024697 [Aedes albopictus]|nr:hypothetical protein RP20_CCG024697 [Aedes albopictus]
MCPFFLFLANSTPKANFTHLCFHFSAPNQPASQFTIYKVNKASKKKREKSSAKKERKATKTLAIVLGKCSLQRSSLCK